MMACQWLHGFLIASALLSLSNSALARADLVTPLEQASPRMRFHAGQIANGQPLILPDLPPIPGVASDWYVAQWQHDRYLHAGDAISNDGGLGSGWHFGSVAGESFVDIDKQSGEKGFAYTLFERDGKLTSGGGSNLFLATNMHTDESDLGRRIVLTVKVHVTNAAIRYDQASAETSGAVQAMAFAGIGLLYIDPVSAARRFVFMQVPITVSRRLPGGPGVMCTLSGGVPQLLYAPQSTSLPFRPGKTDSKLSFDLQNLVARMLSRPYPCGAEMLAWAGGQRVLSNWHVTGLYVGLETQNRDARAPAATERPQGSASLGIRISSLTVWSEP